MLSTAMIHNRRSMKKCFHKSHEKKCESQEVPEDFLKATELESSYSWVHHANPCKEKGGGRQKKQMLFIFHFISVTTDIQLNDFKTISKVPYKGNYKWVWNQLRLFAAYKVFGVLDPRKVSKSLGRETHRRDPYQALPPAYLFILSLSFRPLFPSNRTCSTLATLPILAALWIFPRSSFRMQCPGWKLILWPLSLTGLMEEPKGEMPFLLLKPKIFFVTEPTSSNHTSPTPQLFRVS